MNKNLLEYYKLCGELNRYEDMTIPLCAAENYVSDFCMRPLISKFEGKYSFTENSGNNSFIGGEYIERLNALLKDECKILFGAKYANADTLTGINCFTICAMSLLSSDDYVLITTPEQGGHSSIPVILNTIGVKYDSIPYDYLNYQIDYKKLNEMCQSGKYRFVIFCQSDIINPPDLKLLHLPKDMGIIYDATQLLGLIATGIVQNPLSVSDRVVLIGGSHKTLPAPSCGLIMTNNKLFIEKLQKHITPDYLRNTQPNHIAALLLALIEQEEYGYNYQKLVVDLANMLGHTLSTLGFYVANLKDTLYTHTHQLFILMSEEETKNYYLTAKHFNITLNQKHKKLFSNNGIRIGTQQIARYNWKEQEIKLLAQLLYQLKANNSKEIMRLRDILIAKKTPYFTYENIAIE